MSSKGMDETIHDLNKNVVSTKNTETSFPGGNGREIMISGSTSPSCRLTDFGLSLVLHMGALKSRT